MSLILELPAVILETIFDFTKTDSYAIIGAVCTTFRDNFSLSERITRTSKYTQSTKLCNVATIILNIPFNSPYLLDDLISRNQIDIIPLVLSRGLEWDHFCVERAAEIGSYNFFAWLKTTELAWLPENAHFSAASSGNLDMMMFLVESGAGYPDDRSFDAAKNLQHHKIVGWLRELELEHDYVMVQAARADDVYAFEQTLVDDHHLNQKYITEACMNGSFDVLEFFRSSVGVGPTIRDVRAAVLIKRFEVVDWVLEFFPDLAENL